MADVKTLTGTIQMRQGAASEWANKNPVLASAEFGYDATNGVVKMGNGSTAWASLARLLDENDLSVINFKLDQLLAANALLRLADCSPAVIEALSRSGNADKAFAVGDEVDVTLTTGEIITLVILGFNHDNLTGGGKAGITFGMKGLLQTTYRMNATNTNVGGWTSSEMRTQTMQTLLSHMPTEWRNIIKPVDKLTSAGNQSTTINTTSDKLFLLSNVEVDGTTSTTYKDEGVQYEYYKTSANRIKRYASGSSGGWWLRSPYATSATAFRRVYGDGSVGGNGASYTYGVAFGFCV